jgi:hypothetical protein
MDLRSMSNSPIFGARIPGDLCARLEDHMQTSGLSEDSLMVEALGQYLENLEGQPEGSDPQSYLLNQQVAALENRLVALEEMLLEESQYVPQYVMLRPRYERRVVAIRQ